MLRCARVAKRCALRLFPGVFPVKTFVDLTREGIVEAFAILPEGWLDLDMEGLLLNPSPRGGVRLF